MIPCRQIWAIGLALLGLAVGSGKAGAGAPKTEVLVVGTIHQRHATDENYTYQDILRILQTFDPDLVCVEIRPQDFRKVPYLKEMMLATVWGLARGKAVAPIDWWEDAGNVRELRDKLAKQPEYTEKEKREKTLYAESPIVARYEKTYGPADDEMKWAKNLGYEFWNGPDYNEFYAEVYRISMEVYGDSPFNLYYQTRNTRMTELIELAIRDHHSRRTIILTGAEHKHFFDRQLRQAPGLEVRDFATILPLKTPQPEEAVRRFLDEDDDAPYYEKGYPADPDAAFRNKLVPLVHGPNMDVFPDTIPPANVERAAKILERWKASGPASDWLAHEQAWVDFLRRDYAQAAGRYLALAQKIDRGEITDGWLRFDTYLNLGRSYDVLGQRDKALSCYDRTEKLLAGTQWERAKDYILQDYRKVPFKRGQPPSQSPPPPLAQVYREVAGQKLKAFVFLPENANVQTPRAAVVLVHGGAWILGSAEWTFAAARRFAGWGLVAVAVDYRLSKDGVTPVEALDDTRAAFRWVREHAAEFKVDPKRVAGFGVSAGGQLVSVAAMGRFPDDDLNAPSARPNLLLLWSPAVFAPSHLLPSGVKVSDHSPMNLVGPSTPPACIINGDQDTMTPLALAKQFRDRIVRAGGVCWLQVYPGVGHLLTRDVAHQTDKFDPDPKFTDDAYAQIERFLKAQGFLPVK